MYSFILKTFGLYTFIYLFYFFICFALCCLLKSHSIKPVQNVTRKMPNGIMDGFFCTVFGTLKKKRLI